MAGILSVRTLGEQLFQQYLEEHAIQYAYQPNLGPPKRPDFMLRDGTGRTIICEVTDLDVGEPDKPVIVALEASRREVAPGITVATGVGALSIPDILKRIRVKIVTELEQLAPFRDQYPLVVVLHNSRSLVTDLGDHMIVRVLSGLLTPRRPLEPPLHAGLSALVVVTVTQAGARIQQRALRGLRKAEGRHRTGVRGRRPTAAELARAYGVLEAENRDWGGILNVEHPSLRVYHNCHATNPLPATAFPPPFASHARLVSHCHERPGLERDAIVREDYFTLQEMPLSARGRGGR
jgi:hypothetical protein